jgi:hypothetical protein
MIHLFVVEALLLLQYQCLDRIEIFQIGKCGQFIYILTLPSCATFLVTNMR